MKNNNLINLYIFHILKFIKLHSSDFTFKVIIHLHNDIWKDKIDLTQHRLTKTCNSFSINCVNFLIGSLVLSRLIFFFFYFKNKLSDRLIKSPFYNVSVLGSNCKYRCLSQISTVSFLWFYIITYIYVTCSLLMMRFRAMPCDPCMCMARVPTILLVLSYCLCIPSISWSAVIYCEQPTNILLNQILPFILFELK